jgi:hypothetical protein
MMNEGNQSSGTETKGEPRYLYTRFKNDTSPDGPCSLGFLRSLFVRRHVTLKTFVKEPGAKEWVQFDVLLSPEMVRHDMMERLTTIQLTQLFWIRITGFVSLMSFLSAILFGIIIMK